MGSLCVKTLVPVLKTFSWTYSQGEGMNRLLIDNPRFLKDLVGHKLSIKESKLETKTEKECCPILENEIVRLKHRGINT